MRSGSAFLMALRTERAKRDVFCLISSGFVRSKLDGGEMGKEAGYGGDVYLRWRTRSLKPEMEGARSCYNNQRDLPSSPRRLKFTSQRRSGKVTHT